MANVTITVPVVLEFEAPDELKSERIYEMAEVVYEQAKTYDFDFPGFDKCRVDID